MDQTLSDYNRRLAAWKLQNFTAKSLGNLGQKFNSGGFAIPFYGLTVVALIGPGSDLHQQLRDYQNRIRGALHAAGFGPLFSFLDPLSFHMTICDIMARSTPLPKSKLHDAIKMGRHCFSNISRLSELSCQLTGLGVDVSLLQLINFNDESFLNQCLNLEQQLKQAFRVDERSFLGHISLAYFVQSPGPAIARIKETLEPYSNEVLGEFTPRKVSLCHFSDMNTYTPLLSLDLMNGQVEDYSNTLNSLTL